MNLQKIENEINEVLENYTINPIRMSETPEELLKSLKIRIIMAIDDLSWYNNINERFDVVQDIKSDLYTSNIYSVEQLNGLFALVLADTHHYKKLNTELLPFFKLLQNEVA